MSPARSTPEKRKGDFSDARTSKKVSKPVISLRQTPEEEARSKSYFQPKLFTPEYIADLKHRIETSGPYHWGSIADLIDNQVLRNVRKEILQEIHFTKKETDIYKVFQSGDLANLSGLSEELRKRLPSLYKVRSALYSKAFRDLVSNVTGCGKLSGVKMDISIHLYNKTCHLLTHDDVIGSRRVSYILYMPDPDKKWKPSDGGALRLFDSIVPNVPKSDPCAQLTPQFDQIAFFHVQPGLSFHDVEEVLASKQRLSLQGWFHIPQPGEDGYIPGEQEKTESKSTLEQLETKELREYDFPKLELNPVPEQEIKEFSLGLTDDDKTYLMKFMNPLLLSQGSIAQMGSSFSEDSVVDILSFLNDDFAGLLQKKLKHFELNEYPPMPSKQDEVKYPWKLAIPSHKRRYAYIDGTPQQDISSAESIRKVNETYPQELPDFKLTAEIFGLLKEKESRKQIVASADADATTCNDVSQRLCELASFFKSIAFGKWLYQVTKLKVLKEKILIRRFRPGHDFILATKLDKEEEGGDDSSFLDGVLEATLNLTPTSGWENGEWGAYELCMVDESDNKAKDEGKLNEDEAAIYRSSDADESVAYESQACWNKLCLMFRDPSVMKFVKYISADSPGSRWDITATWKCQDDDDDDDDNDE
ncbi:DEKNAAC100445 [Brettanomyces naardenensis]|uniref:uS12 prolyl 3,4-dihydroxylase n=1 Tax=Brettanomyces naardenensis TaxID=13370 RepID=A0A448YGK9_BRENA|nr:DEKNAAC100445 [Brettanomyces naardenensis]